MQATKPLKLIAAASAVLAAAVLFIVIAYASELAFDLYNKIRETSELLANLYFGALLAFAITGGIFVWRLLSPRSSPKTTPKPRSEDQLRTDLERHGEAGIDIGAAQAELELLDERREASKVYIALYGQVSHGKSSLIRALVPEATIETGVIGGTTTDVSHYYWKSPSEDQLILADVPGFNQADGGNPEVAHDEAMRAHLVIFVCDGDLTRDQWRDLETLGQVNKPILVAINKMDRYTRDELSSIRSRISERLKSDIPVVAVQAGGMAEVIRVATDGTEERVLRERPAEIEELIVQLQNTLLEQQEKIAELRDSAVFMLTANKLDSALVSYRQDAANDLVTRYTRRAVVGGLAAFAPGADIIIQGSLAVMLTRALCKLYEVPFRQMDLDKFIKHVSDKVGKPTPLLLAVAGNAFKAFPGVGTVAGGLTHAVAYGLLFQSFGSALVNTLQTHGELKTDAAIQAFEENLSEDLAARAKALVAFALTRKKSGSSDG